MNPATQQLVTNLLAESNNFEEFNSAYRAKHREICEAHSPAQRLELYGNLWQPRAAEIEGLWGAKDRLLGSSARESHAPPSQSSPMKGEEEKTRRKL